jgi:hypothetical protein
MDPPQSNVNRSYFGSFLSLLGYGISSIYGRVYRGVMSLLFAPLSVFFRKSSGEIEATESRIEEITTPTDPKV